MNELDILKDLISFNTIKDKDNKKITEYIENFLKEYSFRVERIKDKNANDCLIAEIGNNPILGFMGHMDTVSDNESWITDPFTLKKDNNKLIGLGACDMKGGIAAFLSAITKVDFSKLKRGIKLIFTTDEESDFEGIISVIENRVSFPPYMIVAEPTALIPVTASKGALGYEITFKGKAAHGSNPSAGKNAIIDAIKFIDKLNLYIKELEKDKDTFFDINHTTCNLGTINGGTMTNVIPDKCIITFDIRTIKNEHNTLIDTFINETCKVFDYIIRKAFDLKVMQNKDESFINTIEKITTSSKGVNYLTEASYLNDVSAIILGPGPVTAHEANEYIEIDMFKKTILVYEEIINKLCS